MIKQTLERIRHKEISVRELTKAYLRRIARTDLELNAFITLDTYGALERAIIIDHLLARSNDPDEYFKTYPLLGIPIAHKDIFSTKGLETTAASNILHGYVPPYDATVMQRLDDAGAVVLGKLNCDAFAHGGCGENSDYGATKNPYDMTRVAGGSSSGSGAAVATDLCMCATGTDTGGSLRTPASYTNTVAIKPTYSRVSRYGIIAMASSTDSVGHITQTVADSAFVLQQTAGFDPHDATSAKEPVEDYAEGLSKGVQGLKIGIPKEYMSESVDSEIRAVVQQNIAIYEKFGARITEVSLPHTDYALAVYYVVMPSEVSSNLSRFDGIRFGYDRTAFGAEAKRRIMIGTYALSAGYYDAYYLKAQKVRSLLIEDFMNAYKKVDVLLAPVSPVLPPKLGERVDDPMQMYLLDVFMIAANLVGIPALAVPGGFSKKGLPIGVQLMGKHFDEATLFRAGYTLEQELGLWKRKPKLK